MPAACPSPSSAAPGVLRISGAIFRDWLRAKDVQGQRRRVLEVHVGWFGANLLDNCGHMQTIEIRNRND